MSKELVISAASHERRVAILEEGQLVEIYIEREKEFALVGSIYKGRVTRVLPGMQSAFVDIGLDGDAFLYVSDVFENLEDYDAGHPHTEQGIPALASPPASLPPIEVLPGETLTHSAVSHDEAHSDEIHRDDVSHDASLHDASSSVDETRAVSNELPGERLGGAHDEARPGAIEERQPDSNASAPQNFSPQYNPTQNYPARSDRGGERNDRGGDRGGGGRWGRRGGRRHGGRQQGPGGRNLPPSKYASPQGGESRGYEQRGHDNRGGQPRSFDNRRPENPRYSAPTGAAEEPIVLPGESLAKYRGKPLPPPVAPSAEQEPHDARPESEGATSRATNSFTAAGPAPSPAGANVSRRFSGGLPRWVLAEAGAESEAPPAESPAEAQAEASPEIQESSAPSEETLALDAEPVRGDVELSEDQVDALASEFVEAKHEETHEHAKVDALVGGAEFEEDEPEEIHADAATGLSDEEAEEAEERDAEEDQAATESELSEEETEEVEEGRAADRAEMEADAAHESAEHAAAIGGPHVAEEEHAEPGLIEAPAREALAKPAPLEDDSILLPGETRAPRVAGAVERQDFPRDSARIGGNPRSRFQRPYRSGGRDRGRDSRGGRPDSRGGRPDRGGRPGPRFERRGPGGPRHDRGHRGHSGPPRRPQLISEMLKAGQDIVVQIAKEPLGKKGARITSHVALPGRFLVYMPTIDHIGVSRKIASAENRSRLRRIVGEARGAYPGGFIVRTAAGGASDEEIRTDIDFLGKTWNEIKQKNEERKAPALLHRDLNLVERILRDYVSDDFTGIWIDSEEEYGKVVEFVSRFQPKLVNKVKLYSKETPIFEEFGIQHELDKALRAKVWLKSGGYIVINHTEALVAIDVNTGKFVGKGSTRLEDTIVKTNLEAVKEIVRQIRLRDLGGIIVVDFIDMEERRNREKVLSALQQALEQDKAPSKALSFNEFGLVCITRKRTKQALERVLCQPCPYCTGSGMVKSIPTLCYEIQAEARKMATADHEGPNLTLRVHPEIAKALKTRESMLIDELEQNSHKHVIIQSDATLHWEQYDIY